MAGGAVKVGIHCYQSLPSFSKMLSFSWKSPFIDNVHIKIIKTSMGHLPHALMLLWLIFCVKVEEKKSEPAKETTETV